MNPCESMTGLILGSIEGTLDADGRARLASHVAGCRPCRQALAEQAAVKQLLGTLTFAPVSPDFARRVRQRVARPGFLDALNWRAWTLRLAPVAALLAVLAWLPSQSATTRTESLSGVLDAWAAGGSSKTHALLINPEADAYTLLAAALEEPSQ